MKNVTVSNQSKVVKKSGVEELNNIVNEALKNLTVSDVELAIETHANKLDAEKEEYTRASKVANTLLIIANNGKPTDPQFDFMIDNIKYRDLETELYGRKNGVKFQFRFSGDICHVVRQDGESNSFSAKLRSIAIKGGTEQFLSSKGFEVVDEPSFAKEFKKDLAAKLAKRSIVIARQKVDKIACKVTRLSIDSKVTRKAYKMALTAEEKAKKNKK